MQLGFNLWASLSPAPGIRCGTLGAGCCVEPSVGTVGAVRWSFLRHLEQQSKTSACATNPGNRGHIRIPRVQPSSTLCLMSPFGMHSFPAAHGMLYGQQGHRQLHLPSMIFLSCCTCGVLNVSGTTHSFYTLVPRKLGASCILLAKELQGIPLQPLAS